jgi:hypothetical protein
MNNERNDYARGTIENEESTRSLVHTTVDRSLGYIDPGKKLIMFRSGRAEAVPNCRSTIGQNDQ